MSSSTILTAFNDHFSEFVNEIAATFPENVELATAKMSLGMLRKANPRMILNIWKSHVVDKYSDEIDSGDIHFFISKDYRSDVQNADNSSSIMASIDNLREPVRQMTAENQAKTMAYIQNLKKLALLYEKK